MFRPRYRRPPFTDPLNWTDYRWDAGPWHGGRPRRAWAHPFGRRRGNGLMRLIVAGLAVYLGARLVSAFQARNGSWARRGLYGVLLLVIVGAFARHRNGRGYW